MCGILTAYDKEGISTNSFRLALGKLANRGQSSWGLAFFHREWGQWRLFQEDGLPYESHVPEFTSEIFTGETRYPTIGSYDFKPPFPYKNVVLSHNGNILNMHELSNKEWKGDGQFLAWYLQNKVEETGILGGVRELMEQVDGAYSVSGILDSEKIFAFRDPRGIRPLFFGKNNKASAFASETLPLTYLGFNQEEIRTVKPGELVLVEDGNVRSYHLLEKKHRHCVFEWVYFASPSSLIEGNLVYDVRKNLGRQLETLLRAKDISVDYRTEVPDTSRPAVDAMSLGERAELIIRDRYISGRTFIMRSQSERELKAKVKYNFNPKFRGINSILVVDDSIVRGTTMKEIVASLREDTEGLQINIASTFPPIRFPCYFGIDFASKEELIAGDQTIEEIKEEIGADSLTYMTKKKLKEAIGCEDLCTACIDGNYPTEKAREIFENPRGGARDYEMN